MLLISKEYYVNRNNHDDCSILLHVNSCPLFSTSSYLTTPRGNQVYSSQHQQELTSIENYRYIYDDNNAKELKEKRFRSCPSLETTCTYVSTTQQSANNSRYLRKNSFELEKIFKIYISRLYYGTFGQFWLVIGALVNCRAILNYPMSIFGVVAALYPTFIRVLKNSLNFDDEAFLNNSINIDNDSQFKNISTCATVQDVRACSHVILSPFHTVVVEPQQQDSLSDEWGHFADFEESCTSVVTPERVTLTENRKETNQGWYDNYFLLLLKYFHREKAKVE